MWNSRTQKCPRICFARNDISKVILKKDVIKIFIQIVRLCAQQDRKKNLKITVIVVKFKLDIFCFLFNKCPVELTELSTEHEIKRSESSWIVYSRAID